MKKSNYCLSTILLIFLILLAGILIYKCFFHNRVEFFSNNNEEDITCQLFYWNDCGHCKKMMPDWELFEEKYPNHAIKTEKNDISSAQQEEFEINGYPLIVLVKDGKKYKEYSGPRTFSGFEEFLKEN